MLPLKQLLTLALASIAVGQSSLDVSHDGSCGNGVSCLGSMFGGCCSVYGNCGSTLAYCGVGCQSKYGHCEKTAGQPSPEGTCGGDVGFTCKDSGYGNCCSQYQYCGSSEDYCGTGCLSGFGDCSLSNSSIPSSNYSASIISGSAIPSSISSDFCTATTNSAASSNYSASIFPGSVMSSSISSGFFTTTTNSAITTISAANSNYSASIISGSVMPSSISSGFFTATTSSAITTISAASSTVSPNVTPAWSSVATASASVCANDITKQQQNESCVPCDGQSGSLPYCGADVYTNSYRFTPKTCRTVYYEFNITNGTVAPDGIERIALLVNGQLPGPKIEANWGDTVVVKVNNMLQTNGTSIHFHGIRQLNNSEYDGVPSITQCPIAPGDSFTYTWTATSYGTSWYHSHYAIQAWMGVSGPMVIHGPTSQEFDVDAGTIFLNDWSHTPVDAMYDDAQDSVSGGPRTMDNGLINGKNTWGVQDTANQTGERYELPNTFEPGKTYLLRIINGAIQSSYKFYIDGHQMEVISMDFTSIQPYTTDVLSIEIGQRYMVLVKADQPAGNYWMRADNQNACALTIQADDIKGIIRYSGSNNTTVPTSTKHDYTGGCVDEPLASLIPIAKLNPTSSDVAYAENITLGVSGHLYKWYLSGTTFMSHYEDPTLVRILADGTAPAYSGDLILDLPDMGTWVYIVIESAIPLNHPIHLHGHDFFVLAAGQGTYSSSTFLNLNNPPRRDTANMPGGGYLVIAFETDNPGTWLMHCHIGWHTSMGFALQILEGKSMIGDTVKDKCGLYDTCEKWTDWTEEVGFYQLDSGV